MASHSETTSDYGEVGSESTVTVQQLSQQVASLTDENANMRQYMFALLRNQSALMGVIGEEAAVYRNIPGCQRITAKMDVLTNLSTLLDKRIETMASDSPYDTELADDDTLLDLLRRMTSAERSRLNKLLTHELTKDNALALKLNVAEGKQWGSSNAAAVVGSATVDALARSLVEPVEEEYLDVDSPISPTSQESATSATSTRSKRAKSSAAATGRRPSTSSGGGKKGAGVTGGAQKKAESSANTKGSKKKQQLDAEEVQKRKEASKAKAAETRKRNAAAAAAQQAAAAAQQQKVGLTPQAPTDDDTAGTGTAPPKKLPCKDGDGRNGAALPPAGEEIVDGGAAGGGTNTKVAVVEQPDKDSGTHTDDNSAENAAPTEGVVSVGVFTAKWEKALLRKGDMVALALERSAGGAIITCPPATVLLNIPGDWLEKYIDIVDREHDVGMRFQTAKNLGEAVASFMMHIAQAFVTELDTHPTIFDGAWDPDVPAETAKEFNQKQGVFGCAFLRAAMHYISGQQLPPDITLSALREATKVARKGLHQYRANRAPVSQALAALDM